MPFQTALMYSHNIIIIVQDNSTANTSRLMNWINVHTNTDGILSPIVNGCRNLLLISKKHLINLDSLQKEKVTTIGESDFSNDAFNQANNYLLQLSPMENSIIIIDEIGGLELKEKGLYKGLKHQLNLASESREDHQLFIVVKESLLDECKKKFKLDNVKLITMDDFDTTENPIKPISLSGLVLCGGKSSRMGTDKAFLHYHQTGQYQFITKLFSDSGIPVIISCNEEQQQKIPVEYSTLIDDETFKNNGPISGLLTAFKNNPNLSFILIGCDYPLVQQKHIDVLLSLSQFGFDAVCFVRKSNQENIEPLLTFYNNTVKQKLHHSFKSGNTSLKNILGEINTLKIIAEEESFLKSFDTPEAFHSFHH